MYGIKPNFTDRQGYLVWRTVWAKVYKRVIENIQAMKKKVSLAHKTGSADAPQMHKHLHLMRRDATRLMTLLQDAKERRDRILDMHKSLANQGFPLEVGECRHVDFHFNRGSNEFNFLPNWVVKAKGKSFYVTDLDAQVGFSTKNKDMGSTRGMLRFSKCNLSIDENGVAHLS